MSDETPPFIDATEELQRFRLMLRGIWNSYLYADPEVRDWDMVATFRQCEPFLFDTLFAEKLRRRLKIAETTAVTLLIVPDHQGTNIMINCGTERPSSGVWTHPPARIDPTDMTLRFLEFFDWGPLDFRDNELIRVEILASARYPDVVGREALIDAKRVRAVPLSGTSNSANNPK